MQENKEFEHWKRSSFLGMEIINDYSDLGYTELTDVQVQEIYEAGQQSRDKEIRRIKERLTTCKLNAENTISIIGNKYETD